MWFRVKWYSLNNEMSLHTCPAANAGLHIELVPYADCPFSVLRQHQYVYPSLARHHHWLRMKSYPVECFCLIYNTCSLCLPSTLTVHEMVHSLINFVSFDRHFTYTFSFLLIVMSVLSSTIFSQKLWRTYVWKYHLFNCIVHRVQHFSSCLFTSINFGFVLKMLSNSHTDSGAGCIEQGNTLSVSVHFCYHHFHSSHYPRVYQRSEALDLVCFCWRACVTHICSFKPSCRVTVDT